MSERKSDFVKLLQGNRGKRRLDIRTDPTIEAGTPERPSELRGEALKQWRWLEEELTRRRVLTTGDRGLMLLCCEAWAEYLKLKRLCARKRSFTFTQTGTMGQRMQKRHVEFELRDRAEKKYHHYLAEFGLTATTRTRVKALADGPQSDVAKFFEPRK